MRRQGVEPATSRSQVQRPTTTPPSDKLNTAENHITGMPAVYKYRYMIALSTVGGVA